MAKVVFNLRSLTSLLGDTDDCNEELANTHDSRTIKKQSTTPKLLNHPERGRSGDHIDNVHNGRNEEGVLHAYGLEESSTVVDWWRRKS